MSTARLQAAIASLSGRIFVLGGSSDKTTFLSSVECYDPTKNIWSNVAPMISRRRGAKAAAVNGHLYVIGGFDGSTRLATIERYDQQKNQWTMVSEHNSIKIIY